MNLVDANVLLYAVNSDAPHHERARRWLDEALSGADTVAFAWIALLAFVRLSTRPDIFPNPLTLEDAMDQVAFLNGRQKNNVREFSYFLPLAVLQNNV